MGTVRRNSLFSSKVLNVRCKPPSCSPRSRPTSSRSRRPRRLPPSTWPSSGRPSKSWRRLRSAQSLLPFSNSSRRIHRKAQLNLEKKSEQLCKKNWTSPDLRLQKLPVSELQNTSSLIAPHPVSNSPLDVLLGLYHCVPASSL